MTHHSMTCPQTEKISSWIDGELSSAEARVLERHVADCRECQLAQSDFLNLRSEIVGFTPAVDRAASQQALARVLARTHTNVPSSRAKGFDLFAAICFRPAFAGVALLVIGAIFGLLIYRNSLRHDSPAQPKSAQGFVSQKKALNAPAPTSAAEASPSPLTRPTEGAVKRNESKRPKQRSRPPIEIPKTRRVPNDIISPWSNQAIAADRSEEVPTETVFTNSNSADAGSLTQRHLGQSELLLRSFRNVRTARAGHHAEVGYERRRAQKLVYQNILLRREADARGDVQMATLLDSLEPILLDIANLPERPLEDDVRAIKDRLQRKNLVALLQVNSTVLARANE